MSQSSCTRGSGRHRISQPMKQRRRSDSRSNPCRESSSGASPLIEEVRGCTTGNCAETTVLTPSIAIHIARGRKVRLRTRMASSGENCLVLSISTISHTLTSMPSKKNSTIGLGRNSATAPPTKPPMNTSRHEKWCIETLNSTIVNGKLKCRVFREIEMSGFRGANFTSNLVHNNGESSQSRRQHPGLDTTGAGSTLGNGLCVEVFAT